MYHMNKISQAILFGFMIRTFNIALHLPSVYFSKGFLRSILTIGIRKGKRGKKLKTSCNVVPNCAFSMMLNCAPRIIKLQKYGVFLYLIYV